MTLQKQLSELFFPYVKKPGRYLGNELGTCRKDDKSLTRMAIAFPDKYELGMSNLGMQIIYNLVNKLDYASCERVYAPDHDAEKLLRENKLPLFTLETKTALADLDIIGFTLSYELGYTNMLNMMDLAGIPLLGSERGEDDPLICAGGPVCFNPEPLADFIDFFFIGEVENSLGSLLEIISDSKNNPKIDTLKKLAKLEGVYVPSFYQPIYQDGKLDKLEKLFDEAPDKIYSSIIKDVNPDNYPTQPIVPFEDITHDRLSIEIMRGCGHGCRFCMAGIIYRPKRDRQVIDIVNQAVTMLERSGYDEITLLSLSSSDFKKLDELVSMLLTRLQGKHIKISLPSLRPTMRSLDLAKKISPNDRPALTFALEGGSERMREVVNKQVSIEEFYQVVDEAFRSGWKLIKLYFMIGLPTETDADIDAIADVVNECSRIARKFKGNARINVTISPFSPKAHTPWQWEKQISIDDINSRNQQIRKSFRNKSIQIKTRDPELSCLEGVLGRGDRRLGAVIKSAFQRGARFDGWSEDFNFAIWQAAFDDCQIDIKDYIRERKFEETLPWNHIEKGISLDWLWRERQRTYEIDDISKQQTGDFKISDITLSHNLQDENILATQPEIKKNFGRQPVRKTQNTSMAVPRSRVRIKWSKDESMRYIAHLATIRTFERALRRASIPVSYSQGYHPRQRISFGPPLSFGHFSSAEYLDLQLDSPYSGEMVERLNKNLPNGFNSMAGKSILGKSASLASVINLACYQVLLDDIDKVTQSMVDDCLGREQIFINRIRKSGVKEVEVRGAIHKIELVKNNKAPYLYLELGMGNLGFVKPEEIMQNCFEFDDKEVALLKIQRTDLLVVHNDKRCSPLEVD